jgi:hypothetical protein
MLPALHLHTWLIIRRYATVNKRAEVHLRDDFVPVPSAAEMLELVQSELASTALLRTSGFEGPAAACIHPPVHALDKLWPVLIISQVLVMAALVHPLAGLISVQHASLL